MMQQKKLNFLLLLTIQLFTTSLALASGSNVISFKNGDTFASFQVNIGSKSYSMPVDALASLNEVIALNTSFQVGLSKIEGQVYFVVGDQNGQNWKGLYGLGNLTKTAEYSLTYAFTSNAQQSQTTSLIEKHQAVEVLPSYTIALPAVLTSISFTFNTNPAISVSFDQRAIARIQQSASVAFLTFFQMIENAQYFIVAAFDSNSNQSLGTANVVIPSSVSTAQLTNYWLAYTSGSTIQPPPPLNIRVDQNLVISQTLAASTFNFLKTFTYSNLQQLLHLTEGPSLCYNKTSDTVTTRMQPDYLNINVGNVGFAFNKNPWPNRTLFTSLDSVPWTNGIKLVLLGFDSNDNFISDLTKQAPDHFYLFMFTGDQNIAQSGKLTIGTSDTDLGGTQYPNYSNKLAIGFNAPCDNYASLDVSYPGTFTLRYDGSVQSPQYGPYGPYGD